MSALVQVFGAGMIMNFHAMCGRLQKSAKARKSLGSLALAVQSGAMGMDGGAEWREDGNTDRMRPADQPTGEIGSV